jgi:hypothetical protein
MQCVNRGKHRYPWESALAGLTPFQNCPEVLYSIRIFLYINKKSVPIVKHHSPIYGAAQAWIVGVEGKHRFAKHCSLRELRGGAAT